MLLYYYCVFAKKFSNDNKTAAAQTSQQQQQRELTVKRIHSNTVDSFLNYYHGRQTDHFHFLVRA